MDSPSDIFRDQLREGHGERLEVERERHRLDPCRAPQGTIHRQIIKAAVDKVPFERLDDAERLIVGLIAGEVVACDEKRMEENK
jgi:hypothetical protein